MKQWSKGEKTIDEYLQGLTTQFDQLALLGKPIDHEDQIEYILGSLLEDYKSVVEQIEGRDLSPSITEVHEKLFNKEAKLFSVTPAPSTMVPISANVADMRPRPYKGKQNQRPCQSWENNNSQQYNNQRQDNCIPRGYQGHYQLCGVQGHSAKHCSVLQQHQSSFHNSQMTPQFYPWQPRANLAIGSPTPSSSWLIDSGATHHMISDLYNLSLHQPYSGEDAVLIGDGSVLSTTHTGSLSLPSSPLSSNLKQCLVCPQYSEKLNLCLSSVQ